MLDQLLEYSPNFGVDTLLLLPVLIALEAVLSADNAIALAALSQGLHDLNLQQRALNIGIVLAYVLRMILILSATWVVRFWQFELAGALYLLWLVFQYFTSESEKNDGEHPHHAPRFTSVWQAIPMIAVTDLAFSLDSVTTAIAVSQETWIILLGATIGIITLRFMAGLFVRWLEEFTHLEDAGFITVAFVGIRLLLRVINDSLVPPEWVMVSAIALIFIWGFSKRNQPDESSVSIPTEATPPTTETILDVEEVVETKK
ncbi:TerC family protein [Leptodesmis sp.]|uniref:TerC family protein n=1 Tax=Leptodesmis sp. TaxID=3100501 RepID=UPI0040534784